MASDSTSRAVWTIAVFAAVAFLFVKLFPAIATALKGSGSGSGGPVGSLSGGYARPDLQASQPGGSGGGGKPSAAGALPPGAGQGQNQNQNPFSALSNWVQGVLTQGWANAESIATPDMSIIPFTGLEVSAPLQTTENLDNLPSYDPGDPNAPYVDESDLGDDQTGNNYGGLGAGDDTGGVDNGSPYMGGDPYGGGGDLYYGPDQGDPNGGLGDNGDAGGGDSGDSVEDSGGGQDESD
jgi:hypothetical protein